jgi:hypothetical protein
MEGSYHDFKVEDKQPRPTNEGGWDEKGEEGATTKK